MSQTVIRCSLVLAVLLSCTAAHAETYTVTVKGPDLMADAVRKLEAIYDLPITYEEVIVPYENQERPPAKFPDGISFTYEPVPVDTAPEVRIQIAAKKIAEVLGIYNVAYGQEMFVMHESAVGFHVVQTRYVNKSGDIVSLPPFLDTRVSLEATSGTAEDVINKIFHAAQKTNDQTLYLAKCGGSPCGVGQFYSAPVTITAVNESARNVLDRILPQLPATAEKPCPGQAGCYRDVPAHLSWRVRGSGMLELYIISPPGMLGGQNERDKPFLNAQDHTLTVEGDQPIVKAVEQLEQTYGIPISYEDPPHVPGTENVVDKAGRKLKIDTISITYSVPPENAPIETRRALAGKALSELMIYVQRHSTQYIVVNAGSSSFEVGPQFVLGDGRKVIQEHSFANSPVTIPQEDRTAYQLLEQICQSVSKEGWTLHIGKLPEELFKEHHTRLWSPGGPAIGILDALLKEMAPQPSKSSDLEALHISSVPAPLSWRIFCKPDDNKDCSIDFHTVNPK